jgi:hypothetical protein
VLQIFRGAAAGGGINARTAVRAYDGGVLWMGARRAPGGNGQWLVLTVGWFILVFYKTEYFNPGITDPKNHGVPFKDQIADGRVVEIDGFAVLQWLVGDIPDAGHKFFFKGPGPDRTILCDKFNLALQALQERVLKQDLHIC